MKRRTKYLAWLLSAAMLAGSAPAAVYGGGFETEFPKEELVVEEELTAEESGWSEESAGQPEAAEKAEDFTAEKAVPEPVVEEAPETVPGIETELATESGKIGPQQWTFEDGVLRITGKGAIPDAGMAGHGIWNHLPVERLEIGEGITYIGAYSFEQMRFKAVSLPESLTRIGVGAFMHCAQLTSVHIPSKVVEIGKDAFESCRGLQSLTISDQVKGLQIGLDAFVWNDQLTSLRIPKGVVSIGNSAFAQCRSLETLTIEEGVKEIGDAAFYRCTALEAVTIPGSVKTVGNDAFKECSSLRRAVVEEGVENLGGGSFFGCSSLTDVTLPTTVKVLHEYLFRECKSLKEIVIPEGVETICGGAGSVGAFLWCGNLEKVTFPSTLKVIEQGAFIGTGVRSLVFPEGLEIIEGDAFAECGNLETVSFPSRLESLGGGVFKNCSSLSSLVLPSGIDTIGWGFARGCSNLTKVVIPGTVNRIDRYAFENCVSLGEVYLEGNAPSFASDSFNGVYATIYYPKNNKTYTSEVKQNYGGQLSWKSHQPALRTPSLTDVVNTSSGVKVSWGKVSGASGYSVFRKSGSGSYTYVGRTTNTYYNNNKVTEGTKYTYTVRAYRGSFDTANKNRYDAEYWSGYEKNGVSVVKLRQCLLSSVSNSTSAITVTWNKITGAKGYYIYRKIDSGAYVRIDAVDGNTTSYQDKNIKNGGNYVYMVRAYNGDSLSPYKGIRRVRLSRSLISKAAKSGSTGISVTWGKNVRTSGYQISYETDGVTKTKTVSGSGTTKTTLTGLSRGKTYTIKVRGYKTLSGVKHYAAWSTAKTVKL